MDWISWAFSWVSLLTAGQVAGIALYFVAFAVGHWFRYRLEVAPRSQYGIIEVNGFAGYVIYHLKYVWATIVTTSIFVFACYLVLRDANLPAW